MIFSVTCYSELHNAISFTIDIINLLRRVVNVLNCPNNYLTSVGQMWDIQ